MVERVIRDVSYAEAKVSNLRLHENYTSYPDYKTSGILWLGEIPAHWEMRRLKHLATINDDILPESTDPGFEMAYVDISSVDGVHGIMHTEPLTFDKAPSRARRLVKHGDVIISTVRTYLRAVAPIVRAQHNLVVSTGFAVIRPIELENSFAAYVLSTPYFVERVVADSVGANYPAINASDLACLDVAFPPLTEQRAIAAFLDRETAMIDALVAKKERLIELLQEKRTTLISRAVTKGLDPDVPMKDSGVEWLGEIPAHWEVAPVYARYGVALGKMLDAKRISGDSLGPYVRNVDVQWDSVNTDNLPEMDFPLQERDRYRLQSGDLLVCEGGDVGRTAIWKNEMECFYQKAIHRVRPKSQRDAPRFFFYIMYSLAKRGVFLAEGNPNTISHLTAVQLRHYRVVFPPLSEQQAISEHLDSETAKLDALITRIHEAIEHLKELRAALISAAVTGRIDVREEAVLSEQVGAMTGTAMSRDEA